MPQVFATCLSAKGQRERPGGEAAREADEKSTSSPAIAVMAKLPHTWAVHWHRSRNQIKSTLWSMCRGRPRPTCRLLRCSHAHFHLSRTRWSSGASDHLHTNFRTRERQSIQTQPGPAVESFSQHIVFRPTNRKPLTMLLRSPGLYSQFFRVLAWSSFTGSRGSSFPCRSKDC